MRWITLCATRPEYTEVPKSLIAVPFSSIGEEFAAATKLPRRMAFPVSRLGIESSIYETIRYPRSGRHEDSARIDLILPRLREAAVSPAGPSSCLKRAIARLLTDSMITGATVILEFSAGVTGDLMWSRVS